MPAPSPSSAISKGDKPWWLVAIILLGSVLAVCIVTSNLYAQIFTTIVHGIGITIFVAVISFALALILGFIIAMLGISQFMILRQTARFYVEVIRGIPILVLLFYVAFAGTPWLVSAYNVLITPLVHAGWVSPIQVRDIAPLWRCVIALMIGYSAFIAEIFRAGIQAVDQGQIEAAKALGLSCRHRFRFIIMPQAIRTVFPPLSNDFVSMVKDSSLVSVLGVTDITQMGKVYASGSFRFFETYSMVAYLYLILTIGLSLLLRRVEQRLKNKHK